MAKPTFLDYLTFGPRAGEAARKRFSREEILPALLELQQLKDEQPPPSPVLDLNDGFQTDLPELDFGAAEQARLTRALADAGVDPVKHEESRQLRTRNEALREALAGIRDPAQLANVVNKKDAAPVSLSSGVAYNVYDTDNPIIDESSAVEALARQRTATTDDQRLRTSVLQEFVDDPVTDPLLRTDAANNKKVTNLGRVKVENEDGSVEYRDTVLRPDGTTEYRQPVDAEGTPTRVKPETSGSGGTTLQRDTAFIRDVLGIPDEEALRIKLQLKGKSPEEAWAQIVQESARADFGALARDEKKLRERAERIWRVARPGEPIPEDAPLAPGVDEEPAPRRKDSGRSSDAASDPAANIDDIQKRALADPMLADYGEISFGQFVPGTGLEVLDEQGQVIGYYN